MKSFTVRIREDDLKKLKYIAAYEKRSRNSQVLFLLQKHIEAYERTRQKET